MFGRVAGKVAIISGAGRGMGAETARIFAREGASVVLMDINQDGISACAREIGDRALATKGDVREEADWAKAVSGAVRFFGGVDVLVNNAGVHRCSGIDTWGKADAREMLDINVIGVLLGMQSVTPEM